MLFLTLIFIGFTSCQDQKEENVQTLSVQEAKLIFAEAPDVFILDVRTPEEFAEGHIVGSRNINFYDQDFDEKVAQLDRKQPIYLICESGMRSWKTGVILSEMGFAELYNIDGGFLEWRKSI